MVDAKTEKALFNHTLTGYRHWQLFPMSITDSLKKILSQLQNQEKDILFKI